jgi:hypothetical protein
MNSERRFHSRADIEDLTSYATLADALIERATKNQLADVARLLAFSIGYYDQPYGDVPRDALLKMVRAETLDWTKKPSHCSRLGCRIWSRL